MNKIGEIIVAVRKESGLSQSAVAAKMNVTQQTVSNWENSKALPGLEDLLRLSAILNHDFVTELYSLASANEGETCADSETTEAEECTAEEFSSEETAKHENTISENLSEEHRTSVPPRKIQDARVRSSISHHSTASIFL